MCFRRGCSRGFPMTKESLGVWHLGVGTWDAQHAQLAKCFEGSAGTPLADLNIACGELWIFLSFWSACVFGAIVRLNIKRGFLRVSWVYWIYILVSFYIHFIYLFFLSGVLCLKGLCYGPITGTAEHHLRWRRRPKLRKLRKLQKRWV